MGEEVRAFEHELAKFIGGSRQVVCVATGTAALHLSVACLDIGPGDEVLIPDITYVACFQAVKATGAMPVACDVRSEDAFIDLRDAERKLTSRTRAIMPVHYASGARGLDETYDFARTHGLRVIEDAAHAFGCTYNGVPVGASGDVVCFSFDGIKNITSGEGGAIVTSDVDLARRLRDGRLLGVERDTEQRYAAERSWSFEVNHQGFRYHMSNLLAAIGREQLRKVDQFSRRRRELASRYRNALGAINSINLLSLDWENVVPHIFVIRVAQNVRDKLVSHLNCLDIETGLHYQPNHHLALFSDQSSFPVSDQLAGELITIPLHAELTDQEQDRVIDALRSFFSS